MPVQQRYYTYQDQTFLTVTTETGDVEPEVEESELIGEMKIWPGNLPPPGNLMCFGQELPRTDRLFPVLGTRFGDGDGVTTFNLPDGRGRFMVGQQLGGLPPILLGDTGGERTTELVLANVPAHAHPGRAHRHQVDEHTHGIDAHSHALNAHRHSLGLQTHALEAHAHGMDQHDHNTVIEGSYTVIDGGLGTGADSHTTLHGGDRDESLDFGYSKDTDQGGPTETHSGGGETRDATVATMNAGGDQDGETVPHNNMPPYLCINCIIRG